MNKNTCSARERKLSAAIALGIVTGGLVSLLALPVKADLIDPATLHIGAGAGTPCATGCAGDPNLIGSGNTIDIYQNSGGAPATLVNPVLLILGIPNDATNLFASNPITGVTFYNPYPAAFPAGGTAGSSAFATGGTYGLKAPTSGGFFGDMTSGQEVYSFLTLTGPTDNSNSFTNWAGVDLTTNGITATNFGIYAFALTGSSQLGANGLINALFTSGALPLGTYAVAYGQNGGLKHTLIFDTPFTEAGLTANHQTVSEAGTLAFLGVGLAVFGLQRRKLSLSA